MRTIVLAFLVALSCSAGRAYAQQSVSQTPSSEFTVAKKDVVITHRIIDAPGGAFGYEILSNGKLLVHQTTIPGRPGNSGCRTKAEAERLALFVENKVRAGEMPPTVTKEELDSLAITL